MQRWWKRGFLVLAVGFLAACGGGGDERPDSVLDVVRNDAQYSILADALQATGLDNTVARSERTTLFAPNNNAFAALLAELGLTQTQLFADRALLTTVLNYHVLNARVLRAEVPLGKAIATAQGGIVKVTSANGVLTIKDSRNRTARITSTDRLGSNGVIHAIDRVLLPANRTIVQTAQGLPQFSILVEAVQAAGLGNALSAPGPLTVFAPTNDAFVALLAELGLSKAQLLANVPLLTRVLTFHVLNGRALQADIVPGQAITSLQGSTFSIDAQLGVTDPRARVSQIVSTDVLTSNGVIHVLDRVILPLPAENIVQTALAAPQFSILVEALQAASLVEALSGPGPLTVFAPTNDAFVALLAELGVTKQQLLADLPLLSRVLRYHVVTGRQVSGNLAANAASGQPLTTLQGATFRVAGSPLRVIDARGRAAGIAATDIFAANGVIHTLDRVVLPPAN